MKKALATAVAAAVLLVPASSVEATSGWKGCPWNRDVVTGVHGNYNHYHEHDTGARFFRSGSSTKRYTYYTKTLQSTSWEAVDGDANNYSAWASCW